MTNGVSPKQVSQGECLDTIAEIIAAGLMRLRPRQSTPLSHERAKSSVDCPVRGSGHASPDPGGVWHG